MITLKQELSKLFFCLVIGLLFSKNSISQTKNDVLRIDSIYQICLDEGSNMYGCTLKYYGEMDSILNLVYKKIKLGLNIEEKKKLKERQLKWLKQRDAMFNLLDKKPTSKDFNSIDNKMIKLREKAVFVNDRIYDLIKIYNLTQ